MKTKTLNEYLDLRKGKAKVEHREYCLTDSFEKDPNYFCPKCGSNKLRGLHTHNCEGLDFECRNCKLNYTLWLYTDGGF